MTESTQAPQGFLFAAVTAGIRKPAGPDLAVIVSERPATAAGVFTKNLVTAAPVLLSRRQLRDSKGVARTIVANAGNANCATPNGARIAAATVAAAARLLDIPPTQVLVASTGVIGVPLEDGRIPGALPGAIRELAPGAYEQAARAIMTTDTRPKLAFASVKAGRGREVRVLGMAKGAGMIHPRMATMLAFVVTDAAIPVVRLRAITSAAASHTFNRVSVDGDTSTNDTLFVLANGAGGAVPEARVAAAIEEVMAELSIQIAADGEGARKLIRIEVSGAGNEAAADTIGRAIANSPLFKTAIAGGDPNWGRILSAAGASGAKFDPARAAIVLNGTTVCRRGMAAPFDEAILKAQLTGAREVDVHVSVGRGPGRVRFWTCDLTEDYIRINASYRT